MWGQSFSELFVRGGFVMWPLLGMSIVAIAVALERICVLWSLRTGFRARVAELRAPILDGDADESLRLARRRSDPVSRVAAAYLTHLNASNELRHDVAGREASQSIVVIERRLNWLATIGHLAPMLGLLGTVTGLITAFHKIELHAGQVQPADLAGGIWEALITTVAGLVVALPTLAVHHALDQRVGAVALQMQWMVSYLDEWLGNGPTGSARGKAEFADATAGEQPGFGVNS